MAKNVFYEVAVTLTNDQNLISSFLNFFLQGFPEIGRERNEHMTTTAKNV